MAFLILAKYSERQRVAAFCKYRPVVKYPGYLYLSHFNSHFFFNKNVTKLQ